MQARRLAPVAARLTETLARLGLGNADPQGAPGLFAQWKQRRVSTRWPPIGVLLPEKEARNIR
jgi:hypothetical protein